MNMLSGETIVCLAHEPWHGPWKTYQQIMSLFAESNQVLYIGPARPLRERFGEWLGRGERRPLLERATPALYVYHGPRLLGTVNPGRPLGRRFNGIVNRLRVAHLRRLARRLGTAAPILWLFDPMMVDAVGTFGEKLVVAHILDNYVEFFPPGATALRAVMARNEERLLRRADLVFTVSDSLYRRCLTYNRHSVLVPNGVNYELFQAAIARGELPADVAPIRRPILGYVGAIQGDLDFALLDALTGEHPEWSLVFVGPDELGSGHAARRALFGRPNVHYLGCKPVEDVASYIHACDVCVMPQSVDEASVPDSDSIKCYEYLACGKPVVSTDIPSVRKFRPLVQIARDASEFGRCVEQCLHEEPHWSELRRAAAREHSWRRRAEVLSGAIGERLSEGPGAGHQGIPAPTTSARSFG